ncbi:DNA polymerase III subunit gamma/tau [Gorillibacterium massiliense]|uniref:DNA polymerase III subunit gamma/tau n=1 Tax=Gorillibacterium massiliense TaxID=1280390 RepID=UPI0004B1BB59|nr:DNA polymerase III subunit gamma/tau [Gorillibacterium massiliense]
MAHIALYRRWRPQTFGDIAGQGPIVRTLQNALRENRISHAYLFSGPRGTGKTSAARMLAKAVNCERGPAPEPCNECEACRRMTEGSVVDVIEIDAASNRGVDEIRDLRDKVKYAPTEVRRKVYIIDEVHMLTTEAFNALLKTLEEPPEHAMFILATTEPHRLPATIVSRCQRFDFRRVPLEEQISHLERVCREEGITVEPEGLQMIARLSEGGMRDALSLLDQVASFSGNQVTYENVISVTGGVAAEQFGKLAEALLQKDMGAALESVDGFMQEGKSPDKCMESLLYFFRDLLMIRMIPESSAITERILNPDHYRKTAAGFTADALFRIIDVLNHYQSEMKYSTQPRTLFEVAVLKACSLSDDAEGLAVRIIGETKPSGAEGSSATAADAGELARLQKRMAQMEQQLSKLMERGVAAPAQPSAFSSDGSSLASPSRLAASSGGATSTGGVSLLKGRTKLDRFISQQDSELFRQIKTKWSQVLAQVKDKKITVHAWLVNGTPAAFDQDTLLLAFTSAMHRETTEKPANKQLIEQAMHEVLGHAITLATTMANEWQDALEGGSEAAKKPEAEILRLEPEEPAPREEWVDEAIRLFGEDLVKIKEDQ